MTKDVSDAPQFDLVHECARITLSSVANSVTQHPYMGSQVLVVSLSIYSKL